MVAVTALIFLALVACYLIVDCVLDARSTRTYVCEDARQDDVRGLPPFLPLYGGKCTQGYVPCCDDQVDLWSGQAINASYPFDESCGIRRDVRTKKFIGKRDLIHFERGVRATFAKWTDTPCPQDDTRTLRDIIDTRYGYVLVGLWAYMSYAQVHAFAESMAVSDLSLEGLKQWIEDVQCWASLAKPATPSIQSAPTHNAHTQRVTVRI